MEGMIRFTLFGVSVSIHPSLWGMLAVLGWAFSVPGIPVALSVCLFAVVAFFCLLIHEMGHALVGRHLGGGTPEVALSWLGGDCCNATAVFTRPQGIFMTLAGPLATLSFCGLSLALSAFLSGGTFFVGTLSCITGQVAPQGSALYPASVTVFLFYAVQISFWWTLLNLLPVFPLDGGQLMHGLMASSRRMHRISLGVAAPVAVAAALTDMWLLAILMSFLAYFNYRCVQLTSQ